MTKHVPVKAVPDDLSGETRRRLRRRRALGILLLSLLVLVPLGGFIALPTALLAYDESHLESKVCEIDSAEAGSSSSRSLRGVGGSGSQVVITSPDCGTLLLKEGIYRDNVDDVAAAIDAESSGTFQMGAGSDRLQPFLDAIGLSIRVYGFSATR